MYEKITKCPIFFIIIARKISRILGGMCPLPPSPTPIYSDIAAEATENAGRENEGPIRKAGKCIDACKWFGLPFFRCSSEVLLCCIRTQFTSNPETGRCSRYCAIVSFTFLHTSAYVCVLRRWCEFAQGMRLVFMSPRILYVFYCRLLDPDVPDTPDHPESGLTTWKRALKERSQLK